MSHRAGGDSYLTQAFDIEGREIELSSEGREGWL